jgi:DNA processing protein
LSLNFLQQLLTVDPYGRMFPDLVERLEASASFDGSAFLLSHPRLGEKERVLLGKIPWKNVEKASHAGASLLRAKDLSLDWRSTGSPPFYMVRGELGLLTAPRVSIVGTRRASTYGAATASKFAEHLSMSGVTIVSGGALGIDRASHEGALDARGATWAVLGTGVDIYQPSSNAALFDRICQSGGLISMFPAGRAANDYSFVVRNHVIAFLSDAVIIVEAPGKSGALHTARAAVEMGREVFVVPGPISNPNFQGSHALIRDGATLVDHPDQVLEALSIRSGVPVQPTLEFEGPAALIMDALELGPKRVEALGVETGLDPSELMGELTMMEIEGLIRKTPEGYQRS